MNETVLLKRRFKRWQALVVSAVMLVMVSCMCSSPAKESEFYAIYQSKGNCACTGSTYICTKDGTQTSFADSYFCQQKQLNAAGVCTCDGTTLVCTYYACEYDNYQNPFDTSIYAACDANGINDSLTTSTSRGAPTSHSVTDRFENSDLCAGNPPGTEAPTEALLITETSTETEAATATLTPTATSTDTPTPTATNTPTEAVNATETETQPPPPAQCEAGWLPDSGCTCCGSTLVCSDGTVAQFNPTCTGGGGGAKPGATGTP